MTLGEKLQMLRKEQGLSQEALAAKVNVTRQTISKWELNQSTPDLALLAQLSDLFPRLDRLSDPERADGSGGASRKENAVFFYGGGKTHASDRAFAFGPHRSRHLPDLRPLHLRPSVVVSDRRRVHRCRMAHSASGSGRKGQNPLQNAVDPLSGSLPTAGCSCCAFEDPRPFYAGKLHHSALHPSPLASVLVFPEISRPALVRLWLLSAGDCSPSHCYPVLHLPFSAPVPGRFLVYPVQQRHHRHSGVGMFRS